MTTSPEPDHLGHRARLRRKFLNAGVAALHDHELLELLLFHAVPRKDTKPLAKALLARFAGIAGVLDATPDELRAVKGLSDTSIALIGLVRELGTARLAEKMTGGAALSSPQAVVAFARSALAGRRHEAFLAVFLNAKNKVLGHQVIHEGTVDHAVVYPRRVIEQALARRAAGLILVHNHPSGDTAPSEDDKRLTARIGEAARHIDIRVLDHIIVGGGGYFSFAEQRLL
ncbi:MAG TPA: DNA repair protein RadC [Candidatus Edwardsbacteria bacterium]|nr:DNA repair protein RadC [Candidatus Edwardsbacteria bacterium]